MAERFEQNVKFKIDNLSQLKKASDELERLVKASKALDGSATLGRGGAKDASGRNLSQRAANLRANLKGVELDVFKGKINSARQLGLAMGSLTNSVRSLQREDKKYNSVALQLEKTHKRLRNDIDKRKAATESLVVSEKKLAKSSANVANAGGVGGARAIRQSGINSPGGDSKINSSASFLLQNIGFGIQDSPFGIRGIANNISASTNAFALLQRQIKLTNAATGSSLSMFGVLSKTLNSPVGIILLVGSVLPAALEILSSNWDNITAAMSRVNSAFNEFTENAKEARKEAAKSTESSVVSTFLDAAKKKTEAGFTGSEGVLSSQLSVEIARLKEIRKLLTKLAESEGVSPEKVIEALRNPEGLKNVPLPKASLNFNTTAGLDPGIKRLSKEEREEINRATKENARINKIKKIVDATFGPNLGITLNEIIERIRVLAQALNIFGDIPGVGPKSPALRPGIGFARGNNKPIFDIGPSRKAIVDIGSRSRDDFTSVFENEALRRGLEVNDFAFSRQVARDRQRSKLADLEARSFKSTVTFDPRTGASVIESKQILSDREIAAERIKIARETSDEIVSITQQESERRAFFMREVIGVAGDVASLIFGANDRNSRKAFNVNKAVASSENVINTQLAMAKAEGSAGFFGIPLAKILLARGITRGLVIAAQKYNKPSRNSNDPSLSNGLRRAFGFGQISSNNFGGLFGVDGNEINNNINNVNPFLFGQFTMTEGTQTIVKNGQMKLQRRNEQKNLSYLS